MLSDRVRARLGQLNRTVAASGQAVAATGGAMARDRTARLTTGTLPLPDGREVHNAAGKHWLIEKPLESLWNGGTTKIQRVQRRWQHAPAPDEPRDEVTQAFREGFPHGTVFLDLETCGFAGSVIFLAGVLHTAAEGLTLAQLWAHNYAEEKALLLSLWQRVAGQKVLVTFNGKSFDWPQVHDRSTVHHLGRDMRPVTKARHSATRPSRPRTEATAGDPAELISRDTPRPDPLHYDLLHHARRRWKTQLPNCRLQTLERLICGRHRSGDIPGREIPDAYHQYVRTGDTHDVRAILHHNALDLVTLLQLSLQIA